MENRQTTSGRSTPDNSLQKFIFGIYGTKNAKTGRQLTAEKFDSNAKNLLGCATIKDWEWEKWLAGEVKERDDGKDNAADAWERVP